ncbi:MAG: hypothetical protein JWQ32_3616 [Marmoricola sp.]|nr:hypothetical protein [Marmoricola sp.]
MLAEQLSTRFGAIETVDRHQRDELRDSRPARPCTAPDFDGRQSTANQAIRPGTAPPSLLGTKKHSRQDEGTGQEQGRPTKRVDIPMQGTCPYWRTFVTQRLRSQTIAVSLPLVIVLCIVNPHLLVFIALGAALGAAYWYPKFVLPIAGAALLVTLIFVVLKSESLPPLHYLQRERDVQMTVKANYDTERNGWTVQGIFAVPLDSLEAVTNHSPGDIWLDEGSNGLTYAQQLERLNRELDEQVWRLAREQGGEPVYESVRNDFVPAQARYYPLRSKSELPWPAVQLKSPNFVLAPGKGSVLEITAPAGMIVSTNPPSEPKPIPSGELRIVNVGQEGLHSSSTEIEVASPLARYEPLRSLPDLLRGDVIGWILAGSVTLLLGAVKDRVKAAIGGLLKRRVADD